MTKSSTEGASTMNVTYWLLGIVMLTTVVLLAMGHSEAGAWGCLVLVGYALSREAVRTWIWARLQGAWCGLRAAWQDKQLRWHLIPIVVLSLGGGFLLMGLTGFLLLQGHQIIINLILGAKTLALPSGDQAWPTAILMALVWPWGFLGAVLLIRRPGVVSLSGAVKALVYGVFVLVWGFGLTWLICR